MQRSIRTAEDGELHRNSDEVRERILQTASALFYSRGVHAVGVDLVVEEAGVAKTSLYRHFHTKDDLIAAYLRREDEEFWSCWNRVTELHKTDPFAELEAHMDWIGERICRPNYRGCPQLNVVAEFPDANHPACKIALAHKQELRRRLKSIAERLRVKRQEELAGQLAVFINGAFLSSQLMFPGEAGPLLRAAAKALVAASREF
jgi:AcrR family transcriptional regulator